VNIPNFGAVRRNISFKPGEKFYCLPRQDWDDKTRRNQHKGERCFCIEAEAKANGWRKAEN